MKIYLLSHLFIFAFAYSAFTFALFPYTYFLGASPQYQGTLGFIIMVPNVVLPYFFLRLKNPGKVFRMIILSNIISLIPILYISFSSDLMVILIFSLILGIGQFIWWITTEIYFTMVSEDTNLINLYGIFWGSAYFISPFFASYIITIFSFRALFLLTFSMMVISLIILFFYKEDKIVKENKIDELEEKNGKISLASFFPSFAVGLIIGSLISIFPGYILSNGMGVTHLGYINTVMGFTRLLGFFMLSKLKDPKITIKYILLSFIIEILILIPFLSSYFILLLIAFSILGFGFSFGISAPLIYMSQRKDLDISKNISIYEFSFGISTSASSMLSGYIAQVYGYKFPFLIDFIIVLILLSIFYSFERSSKQ